MNTTENPNQQPDRAEEAIRSLQNKFVLVGRNRMRAWHMWLVVGILAGVLIGIWWVASRSG